MLSCLPRNPAPLLLAWETPLLSTDQVKHLLSKGSQWPKAWSYASSLLSQCPRACLHPYMQCLLPACVSPPSLGIPMKAKHVCLTCMCTQKPRPENEGSHIHSFHNYFTSTYNVPSTVLWTAWWLREVTWFLSSEKLDSRWHCGGAATCYPVSGLPFNGQVPKVGSHRRETFPSSTVQLRVAK